ncbi:MAG: tRNA lysidine(34) synthetase TilS [Bacteroidota bacterium]
MLNRFLQFIKEQNLIQSNDKILVAVSGGVDSMVLLDLFKKSNFNFAIAHCNFKLRGEESNGDAEFVFNYAEENNIELFITEFETTQIAKYRFISIEMAARELRYNWFKEISEKHGFTKIAVGHHSDDSIETFMLNIARGTGISGIHGIRPVNGNIIRPLLAFSRNDINDYALQNSITYREDSTNKSVQIKRNLIRHEIIPRFELLNQSFRNNLNRTIEIMSETEQIFKQKIEEEKQKCVSIENGKTLLSIEKLKQLSPIKTYLFEMLREFGFDRSKAVNIAEHLNGESGKEFFSKTHRLIRDREYLIIELKKEIDTTTYKITLNDYPSFLSIEETKDKPDLKNNANNIAFFDKEKLDFPLTLRRWKHGDFFYPLGMKNKKKLSDFFNDNKFSISEKESTWVLCNNDEIVWIVGHRIDDRYKINSETSVILKFVLNINLYI